MPSKTITCPKCGFVIQQDKDEFTTLRVSKNFIDKIREHQTDPTYEATLRRLLGWAEEEE